MNRLALVLFSLSASVLLRASSPILTSASAKSPRAAGAVSLDDPEALPGQIIVDPQNPIWFKRNGGLPLFMCGPGDPEDFLYRGTRRADGTRDGDQEVLIGKLRGTGANCVHAIAFRSKTYGGDGAPDHNPFIDSDITKRLDGDILDQWETWFTQLDESGVVIYFFIYDDEIKLSGPMGWNLTASGELPEQERYFITTLVDRFKHHRNLIWVVQEGASKIIWQEEHLKKVAALVRETDNHHHPIAMSEANKLDFFNYAGDPSIDSFSLIYYITDTPASIHQMLLEAKTIARGRYNVTYVESMNYGTGKTMRLKNWAAAMTGTYVQVFKMDIAGTTPEDLKACGNLARFFETTDFTRMKTHDELSLGDADYVLATASGAPKPAYIAYSAHADAGLGIRNLPAGKYDLVWMDCENGVIRRQDGLDAEGDHIWPKPAKLGSELALSLQPSH